MGKRDDILVTVMGFGILLLCVVGGLLIKLNDALNNRLSRAVHWTLDRLIDKHKRMKGR